MTIKTTKRIITEENLDRAIEIAGMGGIDGFVYDQSEYTNQCGTAGCVLFFARREAGLPQDNEVVRPGEIEDTPRAQRIGRLMGCPSPDILLVMRAVRADGTINLAGADMRGARLEDANLSDAILTCANLTGTNLTDADLIGSDFIGANLTNAQMGNAKLHMADFSRANLTGAVFYKADLSVANFKGADLTGVDFSRANLTGAYIRRANLTGAQFYIANLKDADFSDTYTGKAVPYYKFGPMFDGIR